MSDNPPEEEPSIEEILASIRQIISDDDVEEGAEEKAAPAEEVAEPDSVEEILELTEEDVEPEPEPEPAPVIEEEIEEEIEVEMVDRVEPEPELEPEIEPAPAIPSDIMSSTTQAATMGSMAKLASKMPINNSRSYDGVTLEDIVKEMLHPMLREWMDSNLPPMVERIVQKELEKLARRASDD